MKLAKKVSLIVAAVIAVLAITLVVTVELRAHQTFDAPAVDLRASMDPSVIERGRYLAFGPAHCAGCHAPAEKLDALLTGGALEGTPPLSGGFAYPSPIGVLHFPNITPDSETGIGRYTDAELARLLRHGVKPNGEAQLPVMEFQNVSDEDVIALLSFMRSQEPVRRDVPDHELSFLGKLAKAFFIGPRGPTATPPKASPPEAPTIARGEYLANRVAQCAGCHTKRDMSDFSFIGPRFAGGMELEEPWAPDTTFVTPNLTPDPETGHIVGWGEDTFVARFKSGVAPKYSPMDWKMFSRMSEIDLRAVYRYLMSLAPVKNATGPTIRKRD